MRWARNVAVWGRGDLRTAFLDKYESKRSLVKPNCGWKNNIKVHPKEMGWAGMDWINLAPNWSK